MINEHKKGVKAVKYSLKTKNPVAKAHQTVGSGSGAHSNKKKNTSVPRKEKHKKAPELAESNWYSIRLKTMLEDASHDERNHPDHEISMASSELLSIAKNASELLDLIRKYSEQKGLDAWQQSKITKAADYLNTVLQSINGEQQGVAEGAPELLKKEMPLHRHAEKLLAQNGVSKDDPDYHHHLGNTIKHLRQFGNIDLINKSDEQGVAEGRLNEGKGLEGELARFLKSNGFNGPYRLGKLPKWAAELSEFDKTDLIMVQGNDVEYDEFVVDIGYGQLYWGAEGGMTKMTEKAIVNHVKLGQQGVEEDATENVDINNTLSNIEKAIYRQKLQGEEASDKLREYLLDVALNAVGRDKRKFYEPHVMNVNNWDDAREFLNTVFRDASEQGLQETKSNWYQVRLSTMLESKLK